MLFHGKQIPVTPFCRQNGLRYRRQTKKCRPAIRKTLCLCATWHYLKSPGHFWGCCSSFRAGFDRLSLTCLGSATRWQDPAGANVPHRDSALLPASPARPGGYYSGWGPVNPRPADFFIRWRNLSLKGCLMGTFLFLRKLTGFQPALE